MSECIEHPENSPEYEGLKINRGIEQPEAMNPNIAARLKFIKKKTLTTDDYVEGILKGDINILSQAITLVESSKTGKCTANPINSHEYPPPLSRFFYPMPSSHLMPPGASQRRGHHRHGAPSAPSVSFPWDCQWLSQKNLPACHSSACQNMPPNISSRYHPLPLLPPLS